MQYKCFPNHRHLCCICICVLCVTAPPQLDYLQQSFRQPITEHHIINTHTGRISTHNYSEVPQPAPSYLPLTKNLCNAFAGVIVVVITSPQCCRHFADVVPVVLRCLRLHSSDKCRQCAASSRRRIVSGRSVRADRRSQESVRLLGRSEDDQIRTGKAVGMVNKTLANELNTQALNATNSLYSPVGRSTTTTVTVRTLAMNQEPPPARTVTSTAPMPAIGRSVCPARESTTAFATAAMPRTSTPRLRAPPAPTTAPSAVKRIGHAISSALNWPASAVSSRRTWRRADAHAKRSRLPA